MSPPSWPQPSGGRAQHGAWHNAFNRLQRCYEWREIVICAFFDLADTIITVRSLVRQAWTAYRWDAGPARLP